MVSRPLPVVKGEGWSWFFQDSFHVYTCFGSHFRPLQLKRKESLRMLKLSCTSKVTSLIKYSSPGSEREDWEKNYHEVIITVIPHLIGKARLTIWLFYYVDIAWCQLLDNACKYINFASNIGFMKYLVPLHLLALATYFDCLKRELKLCSSLSLLTINLKAKIKWLLNGKPFSYSLHED